MGGMGAGCAGAGFVCENTVGRLRRWMGILGYDVVYDARSAREILSDPMEEGRIVLGRCPSLAREFAEATGLARRLGDRAGGAPWFIHLESEDLAAQIGQVTRLFPMDFERTLFSRCTHCNLPVGPEQGLEAVRDRVPEKTRDWLDAYRECPRCGRVYWLGSHVPRIRAFLRDEAGVEGMNAE